MVSWCSYNFDDDDDDDDDDGGDGDDDDDDDDDDDTFHTISVATNFSIIGDNVGDEEHLARLVRRSDSSPDGQQRRTHRSTFVLFFIFL